MSSVDKLVLLADKLDRDGFPVEAALLDNVIVKKSYDQNTRTEIASVISSINQTLDELVQAASGDNDGESFFSEELSPDQQSFFSGKLGEIRNYVGFLEDLGEELEEETPWPEGEGGDSPAEEESAEEEEGPEEGGPEEEKEPWWKFWESKGEEPAEETTLPTPGKSPIYGPSDLDEDEDQGSLQEEDLDSPTGRVRRTSGGGVTVEQSMSNVGNVNIGE